MQFSSDVLSIIAEKSTKMEYKLLDWIKLDNLCWTELSENPAAVGLLKSRQDKIDWKRLSGNTSPAAIELLKEHGDNIDWRVLSGNPAAIDSLKAKRDEIDWCMLSMNPAIFEVDRPALIAKRNEFIAQIKN